MIDGYRTVAGPASARMTRKKSRFIAFLTPVSSIDEVEAEQERLRSAYHDAAHRPSAYRLLTAGGGIAAHADDDGEPSGSAGRPILMRIESADLLNVLIVVVRYFGGTKLGLGGLARAYSDAAEEALLNARIIAKRIESWIEIDFPPEITSSVMAAIHRHGANLKGIEYDRKAHAVVTIPQSRAEGFIAALRDTTKGRAAAEVIG